MLGRMAREYPRRLTLDVDPADDPIRGRISEGDALAEPFVGWLGMARALERVLGRPAPGDVSAER
jgi:hypothetical protein